MLNDNYERSSDASWKDFKTAVQENVFEVSASIGTCEFIVSQRKEWMKPVEAPIPRFLAATGDRMTEDEVQEDPYGSVLRGAQEPELRCA